MSTAALALLAAIAAVAVASLVAMIVLRARRASDSGSTQAYSRWASGWTRSPTSSRTRWSGCTRTRARAHRRVARPGARPRRGARPLRRGSASLPGVDRRAVVRSTWTACRSPPPQGRRRRDGHGAVGRSAARRTEAGCGPSGSPTTTREAAATERGVRSAIAVPIESGGRPAGLPDRVRRERGASRRRQRVPDARGDRRAHGAAIENARQARRPCCAAVDSDGLTGLGNRQAAPRDARPRGGAGPPPRARLAVCVLDLDDFQRRNARIGQLEAMASSSRSPTLLRETLRPTTSRTAVGGDEFAVILPGVGPDRGAKALYARVQATLRRAGRAPVRVSASRPASPS